jgi:hypothetical protein
VVQPAAGTVGIFVLRPVVPQSLACLEADGNRWFTQKLGNHKMIFTARLAIVCIVLGLILLGVSFAWPRLIKDDQVWSDDQAHELSQAAASLHHMTHEAAEAQLKKTSDAERARWDAELKAAQDRYEKSRSQLDRAKRVRNTAAAVMRWSGVALLLIGIIRYVALKSD